MKYFTKWLTVTMGGFFLLSVDAAPPESQSGPSVHFDGARMKEPIIPIVENSDLNEEVVLLGQRLFNDLRLSRDNTVACASCHVLAMGGVDRLAQSKGVAGRRGDRNAPTVFNAGLNFVQFWDGRVKTLEEQVGDHLHNPRQMDTTWKDLIVKLRQDPEYLKDFRRLYAKGITSLTIASAIAEFVRSLQTPHSRFDQYLLGDKDVLTESELRGYQLFKDYGCISCHQGRLVGGNLFSRLGIMVPYFEMKDEHPSSDLGRYNVTGREEDRFSFKVPGLRNVAVTAPYFHDGSIPTLESVVKIIGKHLLGMTIEEVDVQDIVLFLETLTGEYQGASLS